MQKPNTPIRNNITIAPDEQSESNAIKVLPQQINLQILCGGIYGGMRYGLTKNPGILCTLG